MNPIAEIRVNGLPAPQGSKKHVGRGIMVEASKRVAPWRQDVRAACCHSYFGMPVSCAVHVEITFWFPRPKNHYRTGRFAGLLKENAPTHTTSHSCGDIDKLLRATFDGLAHTTGGIVLKDDSQVVSLRTEKLYATDEPPGALIKVLERY